MGESRYEVGIQMLNRVVGASSAKVRDELRETAPDLERFLAEIFGDIYARPGLDLKSREIATVAALTVLGKLPQLKVHVQGALNVGCSREEILEVFIQMLAYVGFPAVLNAVSAAKEVFQDER